MGAEAIIEKIRKNAAEEAASLRKQGEERAAAAEKQIIDAASAEAEEILRNAKAAAADLERRERLMTGLETRKNTLASRREVIDEAFQKALSDLCALPEERWAALIRRIVLEAAETGRETLLVPEADLSRYRKPFAGDTSMLEQLNAALKEKGLAGELTLSETPAKIRGGVLLSGEKYDVNGSFEMLLSLVREDCEREIYHILYQ